MGKRIFDLPETKGTFEVAGKVLGVEKDGFFKQSETKSGKKRNTSKFSVKSSNDNQISVSVAGNEQEFVYFSKRDKETKKTDVKNVKWENRKKFKEEGYSLIGVHLGLEQEANEKGKISNIKKKMVDFDASEYISEHLKDDMDVYIRGNIDYSSFVTDKDELRRSVRFLPNQISRMSKSVDFDDPDFKETCNFAQTIIFVGIDKDREVDGRFIIEAKIVRYNSIEDTTFYTTNKVLAQTLKKSLKPYNSIKVFGHIVNRIEKEEVEQDDAWGESNPMEQITGSYIREMYVVGANKESLDTETYSEELIEEALLAIKEFGGTEEMNKKKEKKNDKEDWGGIWEENEEEPF